MKKITDKTTLAKILASPKLREVLIKYRVPCLHCPFATLENLINKLRSNNWLKTPLIVDAFLKIKREDFVPLV